MTFDNWWKEYGKDLDSCEYVVAKDSFRAGQEASGEKIATLGERCNQLLKDKGDLTDRCRELEKENAILERRIERAKECMKKLLFIINSDPSNYNCKGLVQDAEDFIYNRTCNIRQHGEHCISETRCIMCDKEIEK
jgi:hypothetical protein